MITKPDNTASSTVKDFIFFIALGGLPSNFFGMVDPQWFHIPGFFDFRMIFILFCGLLSIFMISRWQMLLQLPAGLWLLIAAFYVTAQFILFAFHFGFTDAFKVFRYYCLPIVAIGPLVYVLSLSRERQLRIIRWIFIATILQGIFYIMHHLGFSVFYSPIHEVIDFGAGEVQRYNHAFPPYTLLVMNAALLFFILQKKRYHGLYVIVLTGVIILYATRSLIIQAVFSIMIIMTLTLFKQGGKALARTGMIILFLLMGSFLFMMVFPQYPEFVAERFLELAGPEGLRSAANYNHRMFMVDIAINDMATLKEVLFGHGYEFRLLSDYIPGNLFTELSMQGDAPIAGLLFTEGVIGVLFRLVPFIIFLFVHICFLLKAQTKEDVLISSLVIVSIAGINLGWLQTVALRDLPLSLLPYVMLHSLHSYGRQQAMVLQGEIDDAVLNPMTSINSGKNL